METIAKARYTGGAAPPSGKSVGFRGVRYGVARPSKVAIVSSLTVIDKGNRQ